MQCSPYAAQYFMEALFNHGGDRKAISLMTADGDRSWKHMVNSGTTISWEAWDLKYKPNQDWNHAWGAAPANLLPRFVLGVQPSSPGWTTAKISPCPGGLKHARGQVPTTHGPVEVEWKIESNFTLSLTLPEGMSASVDLPAGDGTTGVFIDGKPVDASQTNDRWIVTDSVTGIVTLEVK
jgi:hypothetical protein